MSNNFIGTIIEESLASKDILEKIKVTKKKTEKVTAKHKTPWLEKWTVLKVEIGADKAAKIADEIAKRLESAHNWYADYKNDDFHFVIFRNKVFRITRTSEEQYAQAKKYGMSLGIPDYQLDFTTK